MRNPRNELRRARRLAGLSQTGLAKKLRIAKSAVSAWEAGDKTPSDPMLPPLASALSMTVGDLLNIIDAEPAMAGAA